MLRIPYSAMWIFIFFVVCTFVTTVRTSDLIGRRCCEENQVLRSGDCVVSDKTFFPPFYANLSEPLETISWQFEPLECPYGYKRKYFPLNGENNSLEIEEDELLLKRRDIVVFKSSPNFCVGLDADGDNQYNAAFCLPDIEKVCNERTCVQKCCPEGEVLSLAQRSCLKQNGTKFSPEFRGIYGESVDSPKDLFVIDGLPKCDLLVLLNPKATPEQRFFVLQNGMLYEPHNSREFRTSTYCLDYFVEIQADVAFVCRETWSRALEIKNQLQTVGLMISCIFLSLTIAFHLAIPTLRDMQSLCLICHMVSLLVADAVLFTGNQFSKSMSFGHCIANAFILQYSFLATFFWLNVMCFDVWRIIKATVNLVQITANEKQKILLYCIYAFGVPLVIVIVTAFMHFLPDHLLYDSVIRPGFGTVSCWFRGDYELLSYFFGFVGVLFFANLVFLGHTIFMMGQAGGAFTCCSKENTFSALSRHHLEAFWQRFSLFSVMALCWVTELLSWKIYPLEIWIPTDIMNSLQGFIVFIIFIRSEKKREEVCKLLKNTRSTVSLATRKISRMVTTGVSWHVTDDEVTTMNTDNSTSTKHTEGSTQETSRTEKPSEGISNPNFD